MTGGKFVLFAVALHSMIVAAKEPKLYKLRFREGAEYCAVVRIPGQWQYAPNMWPPELAPGIWEIRKDVTLPEPGYLMRWNGEYGNGPSNYSQNVFRLEWTGARPESFAVATERWAAAPKVPMIFRSDARIGFEGEGDAVKRIVGGHKFERTGKHWMGSHDEALLSEDSKWLVLQSADGKIVHRTVFGLGPDSPMDGRAHIDVYHVPTGIRKIRLEVNQTDDLGLDALFGETQIYESRYVFIRIDPRPQRLHFLVCKLPAER